MTLAEEQLLVDGANLTLIFLGLGLLAGRILRLHPHLVPSPVPGRVAVAEFGRAELAIAVGLMFFLYLVVRHPAPLRPMSNSVFVGLGLSSYFISRRCDLVEMFGLVPGDWRRVGWQCLVAWAGITVVTMAVHQGWMYWLTNLVGRPELQDKVKELLQTKGGAGRASFLFSACVLAPVSEEMVFRGFLYPALKRFSRPMVAATAVAGAFAVIHLSLGALLPLFVMALLLTAAYEWSGSLWVPIAVHAGFNLTNIVITLCS
jgi:membrane protease YdiL (CAAX protease family)